MNELQAFSILLSLMNKGGGGSGSNITIYNLGDEGSGTIPQDLIDLVNSGKPYMLIEEGSILIPEYQYEGGAEGQRHHFNNCIYPEDDSANIREFNVLDLVLDFDAGTWEIRQAIEWPSQNPKMLTRAPSHDNIQGRIDFVILDQAPQNEYQGYIYIIKES